MGVNEKKERSEVGIGGIMIVKRTKIGAWRGEKLRKWGK